MTFWKCYNGFQCIVDVIIFMQLLGKAQDPVRVLLLVV